jgi:hypothetical protein
VIRYGLSDAFLHHVNVAASSIAPVQTTASPAASSVIGPLDVGSSGSFAKVMQSAQPKASLPKTGDEKPASTKAISLSMRTARVSSTGANAAGDETTSMGSATQQVLSTVAVQSEAADPEQVPSLGSSSEPAPAVTASKAGSEPLQPVLANPSAAEIDASISPKTLNAKLDVKALTTAVAKSSKKSLHVHAASTNNAAISQPIQGAAASMPTSVAQQQPADTATLAPTRPIVTAPSTSAVSAAKAPGVGMQDAMNAPAAQPVQATSGTTQVPSVQGAATVQAAPTSTTSTDDREEPSTGRNVFVDTLAPTAASSQFAAVFVPSLTKQAESSIEHRASSDFLSASIAKADSTPDVLPPQATPVRRLEIALNDPLLGNMDVRAEMRGGALHATLIGTQDSAAASMPALHRFLQQHDVTVHTLTYTTVGEGVAATGSTAFSSSDMGRDTAGRNFAGDAGTGSQQPQGDSSQPQGQRYGTSGTGTNEHSAYTHSTSISMQANTLPNGSTLSIHI